MLLITIIKVLLAIPLVLVLLHTIIRIIRRFHKAPMPEFFAALIDNPFRRRIQPPDRTAARHQLEEGMTVLEVGPGSGTYTVAAAERVGQSGQLVAVDIEPRMVTRLQERVAEKRLTNVHAQVADAHALPFARNSFDAIYLITVMGEIPAPVRAMSEFERVLSSTGTLALSELLPDPDYPRRSTVLRWAESANLCLKKKIGNFFYYTLIFEKAQGGS
jgi:ubiquinone/menaquinone biosynthesis C-methylase UbiE